MTRLPDAPATVSQLDSMCHPVSLCYKLPLQTASVRTIAQVGPPLLAGYLYADRGTQTLWGRHCLLWASVMVAQLMVVIEVPHSSPSGFCGSRTVQYLNRLTHSELTPSFCDSRTAHTLSESLRAYFDFL